MGSIHFSCVLVLDTCLVWEMLVLPSDAQTAPSLPSLRGPDGDTSDQIC